MLARLAAGLLAIFLGSLGIHKFYMGYTGAGVILLLMGTFGWILVFPSVIAIIVGFVEGVVYLTKTDEDFEKVYFREGRTWF